MEWNWKEYNKEKTLFRSYYCSACKQRKPCYVLSEEYCCACAYEKEQERTKEYNNYEKVLIRKEKEQKASFRQLELLQNYPGCKQCGSKGIDANFLYSEKKLVCWTCLVKKEGGATGEISFSQQSQQYKKQWGINLREMLDKFQWLPVNKNCAEKWLKDKEHLENCHCLEQESKETYLLFANSLQKSKEWLAKCACEISKKVRVISDYATNCQGCQGEISVASKKRVIKNRNDPRFWGLVKVKEKVLCGNCLGKYWEQMTGRKKYLFKEYGKRGYWG